MGDDLDRGKVEGGSLVSVALAAAEELRHVADGQERVNDRLPDEHNPCRHLRTTLIADNRRLALALTLAAENSSQPLTDAAERLLELHDGPNVDVRAHDAAWDALREAAKLSGGTAGA